MLRKEWSALKKLIWLYVSALAGGVEPGSTTAVAGYAVAGYAVAGIR